MMRGEDYLCISEKGRRCMGLDKYIDNRRDTGEKRPKIQMQNFTKRFFYSF